MRRGIGFLGVLAVVAALTAATSLAAPARLSHTRFVKIDRTLTAQIGVDRPKPSSAALTAVDRACHALGTKDRLLGSIRNTCLSGLTLLRRTPLFLGCRTKYACTAQSTSMLNATNGLVSHMRTMNKAVNRSVGPGGCHHQLLAQRHDFDEANLLIAAIKSVQHALQTGDAGDIKAAKAKLKIASDSAKDDPSAVTERALFRKYCR